MKYINTIRGFFISLFVIFVLFFFVDSFDYFGDVGIILSISTFLFSILAGFFIARLNNRYENYLNLAVEEDSNFLFLYNISSFFGKEFKDNLREILDEYYIICYDFPLDKQYTHTEKTFSKFYELVENYKEKIKGLSEEIFDDFLGTLKEIEISRNKSYSMSKEKIIPGHWAILFSLGLIVLSCLFVLKNINIYFLIASVIFSTVVVSIFFLLRDIQNLKIYNTSAASDSGQEVFERIGKLNYYNKSSLDKGFLKVPRDVKKYRLGLHKPGEEIRIEIIEKK